MKTVYQIDHRLVHTGVSKEIDDNQPLEHGWVTVPLPDGHEWEELMMVNGKWIPYEEPIVVPFDIQEDVYVTPAPVSKRGYTKREFLDLFPDQELATIYTVAKSNIALEVWVNKLNATTPDELGYSVYLDDPATLAGLGFVYHAGLISEDTYNRFVALSQA